MTTKIYTDKASAKVAAESVTAHAVSIGSDARFIAVKRDKGYAVRRAAWGPQTAVSEMAVECHAATYYSSKACTGTKRQDERARILRFWESQGVARNVGTDERPIWQARDIVNGGAEWLPVVGEGEQHRVDRVELSHVVSAAHDGAWCACNLLPEVGAINEGRGDRDMEDMSPSARAVLAAWPAYWRANLARPASLARLEA